MDSTPKNEFSLLLSDNFTIIPQDFTEVCENIPSTGQERNTTNESKDLPENQNSRYQRPEISNDLDFNITDKCPPKRDEQCEPDQSSSCVNSKLVGKTDKENVLVEDVLFSEEERFESDGTDETKTDERTAVKRTADERTVREKGSHCCLIQDNLQEFRKKPLEEELSESDLHKRYPTETSKLVDYETEPCELICEGDPKEKALRYLEESGVLRMFQNLAAGIVHDRPQQPLLYMMKALEQAKDEDWGELPDFSRFTDAMSGNENGKKFETNN